MLLERKLKTYVQNKDKVHLRALFNDIYLEYRGLIAFNIYQLINNKNDVEELVDDTFLLFYNYVLHHEVLSIKAFLLTTSRNVVNNYLKKEKEISKEEVEVSSNDEFSFFLEELESYLGSEDYSLLYDYYVLEISSKELAEKYHLSRSAIRMRIKRMKNKIKRKYGGNYHV